MRNQEEYSVFLVDDDRIFRRSLEHHLQQKLKHNVRISTFPTGEECLTRMNEEPDIVVLDYLLNSDSPRAINGSEVLREIKKNKAQPVVIMLSGQDKMEVALETMKNGAYDYVVKDDKALVRTQNIVKNAIYSLSLKRQIRKYNFYMKIILGLVAVVLITAVGIEVFFKEILH